MSNKGMDYEKYNKIYLKKGVMTKSGGFVGKYGDNKDLDSKWDRYGNAFDGKESIDDIMQLKPTSMLDIGCGHNQFIKKIKQIKDIRAVGIDIACPSADFIAPAHILPFKVANRIYLKISLAHSKTLIDNEPVHVCVKPKEWWVEISRKYFQDTKVLLHNRKNTLWENIVLYGRK